MSGGGGVFCEGKLTACAVDGDEVGCIMIHESISNLENKSETEERRHPQSRSALMSEDFPIPVAIHRGTSSEV